MESERSQPTNYQIIKIDRSNCWSIYRRLQDLSIKCSLSTGKPLKVEVNDPQTAVQVWSVIKQVSSDRSELIDWLEDCWRKPIRN
ncbi:MAG: Asr1405/Asl0597 family protein [Cyanobacteria bacterium P01_F01_bin.143]